jgi:hypothetical protein
MIDEEFDFLPLRGTIRRGLETRATLRWTPEAILVECLAFYRAQSCFAIQDICTLSLPIYYQANRRCVSQREAAIGDPMVS